MMLKTEAAFSFFFALSESKKEAVLLSATSRFSLTLERRGAWKAGRPPFPGLTSQAPAYSGASDTVVNTGDTEKTQGFVPWLVFVCVYARCPNKKKKKKKKNPVDFFFFPATVYSSLQRNQQTP